MGRNGVGKTTFLKVIMGLHARRRRRAQASTATTCSAAPAEQRARLGIGYVPQGREIFPQLDVEENLRIGLVGAGQEGHHPREGVRALPGAREDAAPARRRPLGRAAAAAGHRPGAGAGPQAAHPRRADRGHPAQHRARDRRRPHAPQPGGQADRPAGRAEAPLRPPGGRSLRHHGPRAHRRLGRRWPSLADDLVHKHLGV